MSEKQFDADFLDKQKEKLLKEKERLESELKKRGTASAVNKDDYTADFQEYGDDEDSNAAEYAQTDTNNSVVEELEEELARVNMALDNLAKGKYGIDKNTGNPIRKERLEANPSAEVDI